MRTVLSSPLRMAALLGALATTACGDSPSGLEAAQQSDAATLATILGKLESIEARLDSIDAAVGGLSGGGLSLTGLPAAQLDSVLALASFLALDATSLSLGVCGKVAFADEIGLQVGAEAEGQAVGSLGAWAGTGAFAGAQVKLKAATAGAAKFAGEWGLELCLPPLGDGPPARPAPSGALRSPELEQIRTTLTGLTTQFNLTPATFVQAMNGVGATISSPASLTLQSLGSQLPLPTALSGLVANPTGYATGRIQGLRADAQGALCTSNQWGSNISAVITEACSVIAAGGLANFTAFADIADTYPAVQTAVSNACTRINSIGLQRLVISSVDVTILGSTYQVFPGYNQRLFPSYTSFACP